MSFPSHFQVHTTLLAMKSTGPQETYITIPVGTLGEILDGNDRLNRPGLVRIRVRNEILYTFARDLHENAFIEQLAYGAAE